MNIVVLLNRLLCFYRLFEAARFSAAIVQDRLGCST